MQVLVGTVIISLPFAVSVLLILLFYMTLGEFASLCRKCFENLFHTDTVCRVLTHLGAPSRLEMVYKIFGKVFGQGACTASLAGYREEVYPKFCPWGGVARMRSAGLSVVL